MRPDAPPEPWLSFLNDLEGELQGVTELHCIGGFAVVQAYGLDRATADIDVVSVAPVSSSPRLMDLAGKESKLRRKHGIHLDVVTVATVPAGYRSRLVALYPGHWRWLRLLAVEAHDLALTRNFERDRGDVEHLARQGYLDASTLRKRYIGELRPYAIGRESWNDLAGATHLLRALPFHIDAHGMPATRSCGDLQEPNGRISVCRPSCPCPLPAGN